MKLIKKEDKIGKVLKKFPQTAEIFNEFGLYCVGCMASEYETIEEGAKAHGKKDVEIEELVKKLNLKL
ncbi:MAG: hypothetical protein A2W22_05185 [Candidatus Levybacteria bacterium RBG_16_35_11]|nr:MAG: hypothetical protein A2W22_05185 [Candidatus Levybacteria bacterium RBG_16_35_11]